MKTKVRKLIYKMPHGNGNILSTRTQDVGLEESRKIDSRTGFPVVLVGSMVEARDSQKE